MISDKKFKRYLSIIILGLISFFLIYYIYPYINGFFGAFIIFTLFYPLFKFLTKKLKFKKSLSAIIIIVLSLILVVIPTFFVLNTAYDQTLDFAKNQNVIIDQIKDFDEQFTFLNLTKIVQDKMPDITNWSGNLLMSGISSAINVGITLIIMFFILYYLFVYKREVKNKFKDLLPFSKNNSQKLMDEFKRVTYATVFTTGLVALMQGILLAILFVILNIEGAVFWGLVAAIFSFLPVLGVPLIWIPFSLYYLINNNIPVAIFLVIGGLIINYSEYFIRPTLQRKLGDIHPLSSIIGIFIGISAFGIIGIVMGPLIINYFFLTIDMFREEHVKKE